MHNNTPRKLEFDLRQLKQSQGFQEWDNSALKHSQNSLPTASLIQV